MVPDLRSVETRYLEHMLRASVVSMSHMSRGAIMKHINRSDFLIWRFPPPVARQKQIAEILDKTDELKAKRQTIDELDELQQAVFWICSEPGYESKKLANGSYWRPSIKHFIWD